MDLWHPGKGEFLEKRDRRFLRLLLQYPPHHEREDNRGSLKERDSDGSLDLPNDGFGLKIGTVVFFWGTSKKIREEKMKKYIFVVLTMTTIALCAQENSNPQTRWLDNRPDDHSPISVMGDHMHPKGEWMFNLEYVHRDMKGLAREGQDITSATGLANTW